MDASSRFYQMTREFTTADAELLGIEWLVRSLINKCALCQANFCLSDILLYLATRRKIISDTESNLFDDESLD